jgi:hypothetical protein
MLTFSLTFIVAWLDDNMDIMIWQDNDIGVAT